MWIYIHLRSVTYLKDTELHAYENFSCRVIAILYINKLPLILICELHLHCYKGTFSN